MASDSDAIAQAVGARLRQGREQAGYSVRGLARKLDVSPSLLSQIENGLARPSVGTLYALVTELGLSLDGMFARDGEAPPRDGKPRVQRAGDRQVLELEGGVRWEQLTPGPDPDALFAFVTYEPGADAATDRPRPARHRGKEYGYVISGRLGIEVGDERIELAPGDAITFGSETPHRFRALGDEPAKAVWMNVAHVV